MYSPQNGKWHPLIASLDTGSAMNLIPKFTADRLGLHTPPIASHQYLMPSEGEVIATPRVSCTWQFPNTSRTYRSEFNVIPNAPFDVLLGSYDIRRLGLLTLASPVAQAEPYVMVDSGVPKISPHLQHSTFASVAVIVITVQRFIRRIRKRRRTRRFTAKGGRWHESSENPPLKTTGNAGN